MNQTIDVRISDLTTDGKGVARSEEGRVLFVEGAVIGDHVEVRISGAPEKGPATAQVLRVLDPSPHRCEHPCPHAGQGCVASPLGNMTVERAFAWKQDHVLNTLSRIGKFDLDESVIQPAISSPDPWQYRERIELSLQFLNGRWELTYQGRDEPVLIQHCKLAMESVNSGLHRLNAHLSGLPGSLADTLPDMTRLLLRDNGQGGAVAVIFLLRERERAAEPLLRWLASAELAGAEIQLVSSVASRFLTAKPTASFGDVQVYQTIAGSELAASPLSFSQANRAMVPLLVEEVLRLIPGKEKVLDLFGGVGMFALEHAQRGGRGIVVEASADAVRAGRHFAREQKLDLHYLRRDLSRTAFADITDETVEAVILDPPRSGITKKLAQEIRDSGPELVVYVSCHAAVLARDLARLCGAPKGKGRQPYSIASLRVLDLFPQTPEMETVAVLRQR